MVNRQVQFLHLKRLIARYSNTHIGTSGKVRLFIPRESNHLNAPCTGNLRRLDNVSGVAGTRNGEQHVAWRPITVNLLGENAHRRFIVAESSSKCSLGNERNRRKCTLKPARSLLAIDLSVRLQKRPIHRSLEAETFYKFAHNMLRIGRRAAIAANKKLTALTEAFGKQLDNKPHLGVTRHQFRVP